MKHKEKETCPLADVRNSMKGNMGKDKVEKPLTISADSSASFPATGREFPPCKACNASESRYHVATKATK